MKKTTKILAVTLTVALLLFTLSLGAFAYGDDENEVTVSDAADTAFTEEGSDEQTLFDVLFSAFRENAPEILSALAFVGSVIIMLCYKKGLLPIINDGLKALKSGIKAIGEKSDSFNEHAVGLCDSIDTRLARAEKLSEAVLKSAEEIENELGEIQNIGAENEKIKEQIRKCE